MMELELTYTAPYDWQAMLSFLALRAIPGLESVSSRRYVRTVTVDDATGIFAVEPLTPGRLQLTVWGLEDHTLPTIVTRVRSLFDLDTDPAAVDACLKRDPALAPLVAARPGLRVPGTWDGFELAVRAVLGQQITVPAATALATKLVYACGRTLPEELAARGRAEGLRFVFPSPELVENIEVAKLGMPRSRAATVLSLAAAVRENAGILKRRRTLEEAIVALRSLSGVGEWTAHYIAMRALRERDAFPATDIGLQRALADSNGKRPSSTEVITRAQAWRPWRAYAALHLWTAEAHRLTCAASAQPVPRRATDSGPGKRRAA